MAKKDKSTLKTFERKAEESNNTIVLAVAAALTMVILSGIVSRSLYVNISYFNKLRAARADTINQLEENISNLTQLTTSYQEVIEEDEGNEERLNNALVTNFDITKIASTLENLASESDMVLTDFEQLNALSLGEEEEVSDDVSVSAQVVPVKIEVSGNYDKLIQMLANSETSLMPFVIRDVTATGTDEELSAEIVLDVFYVDEAALKLDSEIFTP